ncbi:MAG: glucose 1-dehydrogenase [Bacteroidetes bacterium]|nr:MAG: glucose 1-dehydrogenase [Bacteroidota bacterium]
MFDFSNKIVLVTGGAAGIGKTAVEKFAQQGAKIAILDMNPEGRQVAEALQAQGTEARFWQTNVGDWEAMRTTHEEVIAHFGGLDIAVNNAGIGGVWSKLADYPMKDFEKVMQVNLYGVMYGMQLQIKQMLEQKQGIIVNTASVAGLKALSNSAAYVASKHAVVGITKAAAIEYARYNIRVNAICPVFTHTQLVENMLVFDRSMEDKLKKTNPLQRFSTVEEVANAILWLASPEASFITGQAMPLDGGMLA